MGKLLAEEVDQYIHDWCPGKKLGRISFVAHSLGGLITRASLKYLKGYKDKIHGFVSLAVPHLGYMYSKSSLVSAGMWLVRKWKKSTSLK